MKVLLVVWAVVMLTCVAAGIHPRSTWGERLYHGWIWVLVAAAGASGVVMTSIENSPAWLPLSLLVFVALAFHVERGCVDPHFVERP